MEGLGDRVSVALSRDRAARSTTRQNFTRIPAALPNGAKAGHQLSLADTTRELGENNNNNNNNTVIKVSRNYGVERRTVGNGSESVGEGDAEST